MLKNTNGHQLLYFRLLDIFIDQSYMGVCISSF